MKYWTKKKFGFCCVVIAGVYADERCFHPLCAATGSVATDLMILICCYLIDDWNGFDPYRIWLGVHQVYFYFNNFLFKFLINGSIIALMNIKASTCFYCFFLTIIVYWLFSNLFFHGFFLVLGLTTWFFDSYLSMCNLISIMYAVQRILSANTLKNSSNITHKTFFWGKGAIQTILL